MQSQQILACPDKFQPSGFGPMETKVIGNVAIVQSSDAETSTTAGKDSTGKYAWMDIFAKRVDKWMPCARKSPK